MFDFFKPKLKFNLGYFCTPLVWHCNLNCRYCDHFAPLAEKKFFDKKKLEKDFNKIAKYFNIQSIGLMGGEPLLHPEIPQIMDMTRKIFPNTYLMIFTNGILLNQQNTDFWRSMGRNRIILRITRYKLNLDINKIYEKARLHAVRIEWEGSKDGNYKTMHKIALDLEGTQIPYEVYKDCWHHKICCYFEDGKFYRCPIAGNIRHFNKYFNKNLELVKDDFLDVYKIKNLQQIEKYFSNPMSFCRYCNVHDEKDGLDFEISKKDINDWCM